MNQVGLLNYQTQGTERSDMHPYGDASRLTPDASRIAIDHLYFDSAQHMQLTE